MTILSLIIIIAVIVGIVWLLPMAKLPEPFGWVIPVIVVLLLIFFLFSLIGVGNFSLNTRL